MEGNQTLTQPSPSELPSELKLQSRPSESAAGSGKDPDLVADSLVDSEGAVESSISE